LPVESISIRFLPRDATHCVQTAVILSTPSVRLSVTFVRDLCPSGCSANHIIKRYLPFTCPASLVSSNEYDENILPAICYNCCLLSTLFPRERQVTAAWTVYFLRARHTYDVFPLLWHFSFIQIVLRMRLSCLVTYRDCHSGRFLGLFTDTSELPFLLFSSFSTFYISF